MCWNMLLLATKACASYSNCTKWYDEEKHKETKTNFEGAHLSDSWADLAQI